MSIDRRVVTGVSFLIISVMTSGCSTLSQNHGLATAVGSTIGVGTGYFVGKAIAGKDGGMIGAGSGAIIGALLGNQIAKYLDERDRQAAAMATQEALNTPMPSDQARQNDQKPTIAWNSDHNSGVRGRTTIVNAGYDTSGRECRAAEEVAYVGGREIKEQVSYCRDQNSGSWAKAV